MKKTNLSYINKLIDETFGLEWHEDFTPEPERTFRVEISGSNSKYSADLNFENARELVVALASQFTRDEIIDCLHDALKNAQS